MEPMKRLCEISSTDGIISKDMLESLEVSQLHHLLTIDLPDLLQAVKDTYTLKFNHIIIEKFPVEIWSHILKHLIFSAEDKSRSYEGVRLMTVCKYWQRTLYNETVTLSFTLQKLHIKSISSLLNPFTQLRTLYLCDKFNGSYFESTQNLSNLTSLSLINSLFGKVPMLTSLLGLNTLFVSGFYEPKIRENLSQMQLSNITFLGILHNNRLNFGTISLFSELRKLELHHNDTIMGRIDFSSLKHLTCLISSMKGYKNHYAHYKGYAELHSDDDGYYSQGYYKGNVLDGNYDGYGVRTYGGNIECMYEGEFRLGRRNGRGIYTFSKDQTYEGEWCNDRQHGEGIYTKSKGVSFKVTHRNGAETYRSQIQ